MAARDRRASLGTANLNGVDFIEIANSAQTALRVHFINNVTVRSLGATPTITGGETIPSVPVLPFSSPGGDWSHDGDHLVLSLAVAAPGDFSYYTLTLVSDDIDPFFAATTFSFKAGCPTDVDCAAPAQACPPSPGDAPQIDYLAKDFLSFRQALLDFSTQNYPNWQERSEADFGMMFLEALSAIGDDLSYLQDRVAREASLVTATQRRSVTRHARLVDYEPGRAASGTAYLQFDVAPGAPSTFPARAPAIASGADGVRIVFETGLGLNDQSAQPKMDMRWNRSARIRGYWFDDGAICLPVGVTAMFVMGHGYGFYAGQTLLIETQGEGPLDPPLRQLVHLLGIDDPAGAWAVETTDKVFNDPVTRIAWQASDQLTQARDLSKTIVIGNLVAATQGQTVRETFAIGPAASPAPNGPPLTIERAGPSPTGSADDRPVIRMYTLANAPVAWLASSDGSGPASSPEIRVDGADGTWTWSQSLIEARASDRAYTLDAASYRALPINSDGTVACEYDGDSGDTIRFGDGVFGDNPNPGTTFAVTYRVGVGAAGNVAADAINQLDPRSSAAAFFTAVTNPFAASGGADAETILSVQRNAPQKFRSVLQRAVLPQDYVAAAETLPWVKRAGCASRWTGSWLTTFTTPEPKASEAVLTSQRFQLVTLLNQFRMAGSESYVPDPEYVSIDLQITLCVSPQSYAAQVKQDVVSALAPGGATASNTFFAVSRFGFGEPLYRANLEAAIQATPGVGGVTSIAYRLRDQRLDFTEMGWVVNVGASQILRCDNDPSRPAAGAISVTASGGR
jgi:hypothetical protein